MKFITLNDNLLKLYHDSIIQVRNRGRNYPYHGDLILTISDAEKKILEPYFPRYLGYPGYYFDLAIYEVQDPNSRLSWDKLLEFEKCNFDFTNYKFPVYPPHEEYKVYHLPVNFMVMMEFRKSGCLG